ncbi:MAG TPA: ABC transporter substrate-binding protein, partial [Candidatus Limnocylindrales bacterium]|nr:ABC transporter substrate-binding protein [Candidatus Limnocylindrales bacterium]
MGIRASRLHSKTLALLTSLAVAALAACQAAAPSVAPSPSATVASSPLVSAQASGTAPTGQLPQPEKSSLTLAASAVEVTEFLNQLPLAEGLYKKYGLDVSVPFIDGNAAALQALIAGQVDAIGTSPNSTMLTVGTSTPVQDVAVLYNRFYDVIVAKSDITSPGDLRGKKIGISQIGGQSDAEVLMAMKAGGLGQTDASRIQIGGQSARIAALQAGSVDAIPVDGPT